MTPSGQVIALAAVGCMGKYVCEELLADDRFDVVVISRGVRSLHLLSHHDNTLSSKKKSSITHPSILQ